jgi:hypothetical protein
MTRFVNAGGERTLYYSSIPEIQRNAAMIKLTSLALTAALGVAGIGSSLPAAACPTAGVVVRAPAVTVVTPVAYFPGHDRFYFGHDRYWGHGRDWHRGAWRYDRFHHRWY